MSTRARPLFGDDLKRGSGADVSAANLHSSRLRKGRRRSAKAADNNAWALQYGPPATPPRHRSTKHTPQRPPNRTPSKPTAASAAAANAVTSSPSPNAASSSPPKEHKGPDYESPPLSAPADDSASYGSYDGADDSDGGYSGTGDSEYDPDDNAAYDESGDDDDPASDRKRRVEDDRERVSYASRGADYDSVSKRSFAESVLSRVKAKGCTVVEFARGLQWQNYRNRNEVVRLAQALDALLPLIRDGTVPRTAAVTECLARSIASVHEADRTGNWRVADVLQVDDAADSFMPYGLRLKVMEAANKVDRVVKTADRSHRKSNGTNSRSGSSIASGYGSRNRGDRFFNRRGNGWTSNAASDNANATTRRNATTAPPPSRANNNSAGRTASSGGGGGRR